MYVSCRFEIQLFEIVLEFCPGDVEFVDLLTAGDVTLLTGEFCVLDEFTGTVEMDATCPDITPYTAMATITSTTAAATYIRVLLSMPLLSVIAFASDPAVCAATWPL
jgi:hypothetical protein